MIKEIATYVGAAAAFGLGIALIWFPPAALANDPGTYLTAGSFIVGGLGAVGVAVTLPAVRAQAREEGRRAP